MVLKSGKQCARRLKCIEDQIKTDFDIHISVSEHDHDSIAVDALKPAVRDRIIALYSSSREFTAKKIH